MDNPNFLNKIEEDLQYAKATEHLVVAERDELKKLLEENLRYAQAMYADMQRIRKYMFWRMIWGLLWLVVIVAPIVAAIIYLPPLLQNAFQGYRELLGGTSGALDLLGQLKQIK